MIKNINKTINKETLEIKIETKIKDFYSHENKVLTDQQVMEIASSEHEILELISGPEHEVGNYRNSGTKTTGVWIFKLKPKPKPKPARKPRAKKQQPTTAAKKPLTKTSLRSKINKIAKELNEDESNK